jgi:hypothetical protein
LNSAVEILLRLPRHVRELDDSFVFEFTGDEQLFERVARFAQNEHRCCSWAAFAIEMEPFAAGTQGVIRLRYITGLAGKSVVAEGLQQLRELKLDSKAQSRLADILAETKTIVPSTPGQFEQDARTLRGIVERVKSLCGC